MLLTAQLLLDYQRCHRRAFLDLYGEDRQRDPPSDYLLKLRQDSSTYQKVILADHSYHKPEYAPGNWQAGSSATLALMAEGKEMIYQGVLLIPGSQLNFLPLPLATLSQLEDLSCLSVPSLLVKSPGESCFGSWQYTSVEIKWGKRPKQEYQMMAIFHGWVLSQVQGKWPKSLQLILRERSPYTIIDVRKLWSEFETLLTEVVEMMIRPQEPEVFISRQKCSLCQWLTPCHQKAQQQQHLSLLPGITPKRYEILQQLGYTTLEVLSVQNLPVLTQEFGSEVAQQMVRQAQSTLEQRPIFIRSFSAEDLPTTPVELYFDIETEPDLNLEYLFGVLVVDRTAKRSEFYPLLASSPEDQEQMWAAFLELVNHYDPMPIFHFCEYEVKTVISLAKRFQTPASQWQPLVERFVDIHQQVTERVTLPVESYALKSIARWMGFEWRDESASGAQTVYWYDQWRKTGDRTFLDRIIWYNEDDCRATHYIKDWLITHHLNTTTTNPFDNVYERV